MSEIFFEIAKKLQNFLENLNNFQLAAVFNLIMDSMLISTGLTIISIFIGDHLIQMFNLDKRLPRLANLIRLKSTLSKYYKTAYFILHSSLLILTVLGNLVILFAPYIV